MRTRRITLIVVIAVVIIAAAVVVIGADQPQASLSPNRILKDTAPTIAITLAKDFPNQNQISSVRIGGHVVAVQKRGGEGKLSVLLPKLDIVGRADVELIGKGDKTVAVGQLNYVESAERSSKGPWLLLLYVVLIVALPLICTIYDITMSYQERSKVLSKIPANATIAEIKSLLVDMDRGPSGLVGLTRGIVAVTLILILAFAVFHLVVFAPTVPDIAEKLLMLLAGTLTAITGFYFGTKAATAANPPSNSGNGETTDSEVPKIARIEPVTGTGNKKFRVIGEGFGAQEGSVKFSDKGRAKEITVSVTKWENKQIDVDVPSGVNAGMEVEIVVTNHNSKSSDPFKFSITAE